MMQQDRYINTSNREKLRIGLIGFGRMGGKFLATLQNCPQWEVAYVCDIDPYSRALALKQVPEAKIVASDDEIFNDPSVDAVVFATLADQRLRLFEKAVAHGKHVITEKPVADTLNAEWAVVNMAEKSDILVTVNMYLRNSWYHHVMYSMVDEGEIGELAIIRICHMTPGLAPGEGHEYEGPAFHDCGMHYVDIARWHARSDFKTWHSQGVKMWRYKDPWWVQCHGTFQNGVVFDITQGFVYGQLSKDQTHNSYVELIGTKGIVRMTHDFNTAVVELHGVNRTERIERPYGDKNIDCMCERFAESIRNGRLDSLLPTLRESVDASEYAWRFFQDSLTHDCPEIGDADTLVAIRERRRTLKNGYGLLRPRERAGKAE